MSKRKSHQKPNLGDLPPKLRSALQKTWDVTKKGARGVAAGARAVGRTAKKAHGAACEKTRKELSEPSIKLVLESGNNDKLAKSVKAAKWSYEKTCGVKFTSKPKVGG